jgi:hypothetical protein
MAARSGLRMFDDGVVIAVGGEVRAATIGK